MNADEKKTLICSMAAVILAARTSEAREIESASDDEITFAIMDAHCIFGEYDGLEKEFQEDEKEDEPPRPGTDDTDISETYSGCNRCESRPDATHGFPSEYCPQCGRRVRQ